MQAFPNYSPPQIERIQDLLIRLAQGKLLIPRFQREFVWKDEQRQELFRSIYRGLPIGSILTWMTSTHQLASFPRVGGFSVAPAHPDRPRSYILDGHQRMASLLGVLRPSLQAGSPAQNTESASGLRPLYFDLEKEQFELEPRSGRVTPEWVPMSAILNTGDFFAQQRRLSEAGKDDLARRLEYLATVIKDYRVPVVPLVSEDLNLVTDSFRLINNAGTKMSLLHMVNALTWTQDFDLSQNIGDFLESLGPGWRDLDAEIVLRICKAILELDLFDTDAVRVSAALRNVEDRSRTLDQARTALKAAVEFLDVELAICGTQIVPYANQIVLLAEALRPDRVREGAARELRTRLKKWFWITTYTEHFGGMSAGRMSRSLKQIHQIRDAEADPAKELEPPPIEPAGRFSAVTARSRAALWLLAKRRKEVSGSDGFDPFQLLAVDLSRSVFRLVDSRTPGYDTIANRFLLPAELQEAFRQRLERGDLEEREMEAQALTRESVRAFQAGLFEEFLRQRLAILRADEALFVRDLGLEIQGE